MKYSDWKECKLDDIYEIRSGLSKKRDEFGFGYPFLTFREVFNNYFLPSNLNELVNSTEQERKRYSIRKGDIFLTRTSETQHELGLSSVALMDYPEATFNGFTKRLRAKDNEILLPEFAGFYFRSPSFRNQVISMSSMTTRASLNNSMLSSITIKVPPLKIQERISEVLFSITEKIKTNNQTNQTLEETAQAFFKHWFVDFEFPNENGEPYKSSGGKFVESELGMIPEGWEIDTLETLCKISTKSVRPQNNVDVFYEHYSIPAYDESKFPVFEYGADIKSNKYIVETGSFLVSKLNPSTKRVWEPLCITNNAICSTEFIVYLPKSNFYGSFIYSLFNSTQFSDFLIRHATGSTGSRQRVKPRETLMYSTLIPPEGIIKNYERIIRPIREMINLNLIDSQSLIETRDTLLPKLMSGEIRIPDAEQEVEACLQKTN